MVQLPIIPLPKSQGEPTRFNSTLKRLCNDQKLDQFHKDWIGKFATLQNTKFPSAALSGSGSGFNKIFRESRQDCLIVYFRIRKIQGLWDNNRFRFILMSLFIVRENVSIRQVEPYSQHQFEAVVRHFLCFPYNSLELSLVATEHKYFAL